jgi:hypothetical protein
MKEDLASILGAGNLDAVGKILRNPGTNKLYAGFDNSYAAVLEYESLTHYYPSSAMDGLVRFAEYLTALPLDNPEAYPFRDLVVLQPEEVIENIYKKTKWKFTVPNPIPHEHGLKTSRGVLSQRVPHALYQAWRIKQLTAGIDNPRVMEIGAGLGRTAYYGHELGIKDYTIIDLPLTSVSQGYFLSRCLGADALLLSGEEFSDADKRIKILPPEALLDGNREYDLIVNFDSMTEMDKSVAMAYWKKITDCSAQFLSMNHEANDFRVCDLFNEHPRFKSSTRNLCFMRRGYVEEYAQIR